MSRVNFTEGRHRIGGGGETVERWDLEGGGTLSLEFDGNRLRLAAERPRDDRGLYKLWLTGPNGRYPAGTMAPEGDRLTLRRAVSRTELERAGCWPVTGGQVVLAFSFAPSAGWRPEGCPENLIRDPVLRGQFGGPALCRRDGGEVLLAMPFRPDHPMPLVSLFCLARVEGVEGCPHLVWRFDGGGQPIPPHKMPPNGRE